MSQVNLLVPPDASAVAKAVDAYASAARKRYGDRLKGIYLFGSRARGDSKPFSDVDIALILADDDWRSFEETKALSDLAYNLLLETSAEIQPWPFAEREWQDPTLSPSAGLIRAIKRDSRPIWVAP